MFSYTDIFLFAVLVIAAVSDIKSRKIRNWLVFPAIAGGMANALIHNGLRGIGGSLLGIAAGTALLIPFFLLGGIGAGDVKLAAAVGAIKGWNFALSGVFLGSIIAGIFCIAVMFHKGTLIRSARKIYNLFLFLLAFRTVVAIDGKDSLFIPFGFFLCVGFFLYYLLEIKGVIL